MKTMQWIILVAAGLTAIGPRQTSAQTSGGYRLDVVRKTEDERKSDAKRLPFRNVKVRRVETASFYRISIRRMSPAAPEKATLEVLIVAERPGGELIPIACSREPIECPLGIEVVVETDTVELEQIEWKRKMDKGMFGTTLQGYVVRLLDADGRVLEEKAQPTTLRAQADRLIQEWEKQTDPSTHPAPPQPPRPWRRWLP